MHMNPDTVSWKGKQILITGGLGFIGSTLAMHLVKAGASVTIIDAMIPEYGGNLFNVEPIRNQITINYGDICDRHAMNWLVRDKDFVFHLAGQVSHVMSLTDPYPDIEYNIKGTVSLMEALKKHNRSAKVIFTGTRGQYGPATSLPVNEEMPTNPKALYEISNLTAEKIILMYHQMYNIPVVLLRLTNIYGPRAQMKHSHYGVVNWFVRLALDGTPIKVFGDGKIKRDFVYVDDCVQAMLMSSLNPAANGEILNIGWDVPTTFLELACLLSRLVPGCTWDYAPFTAERKAQEPGDFYSDISKIRRLIGWTPTTSLEAGIRETVSYYRDYRDYYWTPEPNVLKRAG